MEFLVKEIKDKEQKAEISREVLSDLPEWFGMPESTEEYITDSQVKTVQSGHYDEYDVTNKFYKAVGYKELEVFSTLWDEWNPCQVFIKYLGD